MERQYFSYGSDAKFKIEEILGEYCFDFDFESIAQEYLRYDKHNGFYLDIPDDDTFWDEVKKFELDSLDKEHYDLVRDFHNICAYDGDKFVWTHDYRLIDWDTFLRYLEEDICVDIWDNNDFDERTGTGRHNFLVSYCEAYEDKYDTPFDVWTCW